MTSRSLVPLLVLALLSNACASLTPPPGRGTHLHSTHGEGATAWAAGAGEPTTPEPEGPRRLHRRQGARDVVTMVGPGGTEDTAGGSALAAHLALLGAVNEVSGSTRRISGELSRLETSHLGIARAGNGIFVRYLEYGERQLGHLTSEFEALREAVRRGAENLQKVLVLKESMEALTLVSALKFTLPALRAATPATLGMGFRVGSGGVVMGTRMVVTAEWVEMMQRLVRAGVLSLPAVSAAVRIQAGQVMMAHGELPRGVREALGEGPEVRGIRVTDSAGAGMGRHPRHHVMPQEFREWFEQRGFTGEMDIDRFCVRLEQAHHQAIHGGGNWKLGRTWPGEWNRMIMEALRDAEVEAGRMLTRNERSPGHRRGGNEALHGSDEMRGP